ncbi:type IV secretion system DNA-binding domain-containing protein [Dolichospermum sp. ST_sed1]|nr:type IV secretion system DNA-binding domain-containing protein [Dolichospermum sp. ST_sed1]MDD1427750.1 type IV secretion system DNA-binding domain-containing protein [Dolichospermum sp. ST_sed9]MDD1430482.1 type IV secretion system DNA-binding domain-containing protein [Dolichospermum sp. ST_sed6]MDD1439175.1 type IV secretion system DNA-binding domain-containing protein [Dolichospermum sp. ST_sed3]MDD1445244.1 type IV secretion system DNA-binding domain-containing protein [Dolichospermum s
MKPLPQATLKPQNKLNQIERSHSGIFLGDKCYWNPATLRNGHAVVLGTSGSGKTQTLKSMAYELPSLFPEIKVILIDLHGDLGLPNEVCYRLDAQAPHGLNPLVLDLDPRGGGSDLQAIAVSSVLRKSLRLGDNQQGLILNAFITCYENRGIFQKQQSTWTNQPPTFADLEAELESRVEDGCKDSEKLLLKMAATFKYGIFSKPQPSLNFPLVRFDLSALAKVPGLSAIAAETLLKQLLDSHKLQGEIKDKTPRCYVILDECKEVKSSDTLARISAEARKFGLCAIVASQRDAHISGEVLANSSLKLVLAVDETEIASVKKRFRFSESLIASLQPLEALVRMDGDGMKTKILPYYLRVKQ